jgi:deazaflavin-dependent oxidoreductase (nitroreductase family)
VTYLRPALVSRVINPVVGWLSPSARLIVPGRVSGRRRTVPVYPVEHGGAVYVVSNRGESDWARNVRAAGGCALRRRGRSTAYTAEELPVAERPPVIAAFREQHPRVTRAYFAKLPDPADHPVFRLTPVR